MRWTEPQARVDSEQPQARVDSVQPQARVGSEQPQVPKKTRHHYHYKKNQKWLKHFLKLNQYQMISSSLTK